MNSKKCYVYRYTDMADNIVKYVGISCRLLNRLQDHYYTDKWCKQSAWIIEYFECENRSEAEAFESHLIALYGTGKYYNKSKVAWGLNKYLPDVESWWKKINSPYADITAYRVAMYVKNMIKQKQFEEAQKYLNLLEFKTVGD